MIPLIVAASAGLGTFLLLKSKDKTTTGLNSPKALADFAAARNADSERIRASNDALRAQGVKIPDGGPRDVVATNILRTTNADARSFAKVSPAGFLGVMTDDSMNSQIARGDLVTVDVNAAGIASSAISSGNMACQVVSPTASDKTIQVISVDPRVSGSGPFAVKVSALTDNMSIIPESTNSILGFGQ